MAQRPRQGQQRALARSVGSDQDPALTRQHTPVDSLQDLSALRRPDADRGESDRGFSLDPVARGSRSSREANDGVHERPNTIDADRHLVPVLQRELGRRDDPGAGHQKHARRELIVP